MKESEGRNASKWKVPDPKYLVKCDDDEYSDLIEVYDPAEEFVIWHNADGLDLYWDFTSVSEAYQRSGRSTWSVVAVLDLLGILEHVPGVHVWTGKTPPPNDGFKAGEWKTV